MHAVMNFPGESVSPLRRYWMVCQQLGSCREARLVQIGGDTSPFHNQAPRWIAEVFLELPFHICLLQIQGRLTLVFPGMMSRSRKAGAIAFWPA